MKIAVCFNRAPAVPLRGELQDQISEAGAETEAEAVAEALRQLGHTVKLVPLGAEISSFVSALQSEQPELVFNLCEGFWGQSSRELHVAALLELLSLPHTGSVPLTLGLTQNKALSKDLLVQHGLPCHVRHDRAQHQREHGRDQNHHTTTTTTGFHPTITLMTIPTV